MSNKYLIPTVKCSWCCSEFQNTGGLFSLDITFKRCLTKCALKFITQDKLHSNVVSAGDDKSSEEGNEYTWIFSPKRELLPYIAFVDRESAVLLT